MDMGVVYVNAVAEGSKAGGPQQLRKENAELVIRSWKREGTVVHVQFTSVQKRGANANRRPVLVAEMEEAAKFVLPLDRDMSGLEDWQGSADALGFRVAVVVDDFEMQPTGRVLVWGNRAKALQIIQGKRARVDAKTPIPAVVQYVRKTYYYVNAGGFLRMLPQGLYDWDPNQRAQVGDEFPVLEMPGRNGGPIVSRRHLQPRLPIPSSWPKLPRGSVVRGKIVRFERASILVELAEDHVRINASMGNMRRIPQVGDDVLVRILGKNEQMYYGVLAK